MVAKTSAGTQNHQSYYFYQLLVAAPQVPALALKYSELSITTFVITAKIIITSIWSAQKSMDRVFFH